MKKAIPQRSPVRLAWHYAKAFLAALLYRFPARSLTVIGITGTDGKTTTVSMIMHILSQEGIAAGALSTAFMQIRDDRTWNTTQKTSPSPFLIQRFLRQLVQSGCTHAVLEISSHGLVQGRLHHTSPSIAAITNTSLEHLDYHGSLEQYRSDKGILFRMLKGKGTKVLNGGDDSFPLFTCIPSQKTITYRAQGKADLWIDAPRITSEGIGARLHHAEESRELALPIPGLFNLENALCAISCTLATGIPIATSCAALRTFQGTPGRMERIDEGQPFSVYVDFTVTPAAYRKTLQTLRAMVAPGKRILVLTGSCGDRMREKRPMVGRICSELADIVCVTNEDPYSEDPDAIITEVWGGIDQSQCQAHRIPDRHTAMAFLFEQAQPGDAVILCAKGSDTTMWTAQGQVPWNEREIARDLLRKQPCTEHI
ncbi:MAG: UDP-N-acetylmuramoyl-L-alanyl-D-glutamate--2,6-diaminopimelate ligase [Candidatus Peribacteraceae bacterium]